MTVQRCASAVLAAGTAALIACGGQEAQQAPDRPDAQQQPERAGEERARHEGADTHRRRREAAGRTALVTDVIDGDTIELQDVGRVRLTGGLSRLSAG